MIEFQHSTFRNRQVFVVLNNGKKHFSGSYKEAVMVYESLASRNRFTKELSCVVCGEVFQKPRYRFKLTCSPGCRGQHVSYFNRKH